jgi:hypothetical protein
MGDEMIMTFKEGNYTKRFYTPNGNLVTEIFLDIEKGKSYYKSFDNDTIYWFDITKNDSKTTFKRSKDSSIIDQPTIVIHTESVIGKTSEKVKAEIHFAKNIKVNPLWYSNYKEGNFNEYIQVGKGVQLRFVMNTPYWTKIINANSIEHKLINKADLKCVLNENSILKEI